jgi:hypothetical protein
MRAAANPNRKAATKSKGSIFLFIIQVLILMLI